MYGRLVVITNYQPRWKWNYPASADGRFGLFFSLSSFFTSGTSPLCGRLECTQHYPHDLMVLCRGFVLFRAVDLFTLSVVPSSAACVRHLDSFVGTDSTFIH